jgi:STE24 endopeptidase
VTSRRAAQFSALVALAGVWAICAWLLWSTTVPSSLHLPRLNEHAYFSAAQLHESASFERVGRLLWLGGVLVQLAVFVLYARSGARFARESAAGPLGTGMLLGMLGFALLWLAELPFEVVSLWWERRHGLVHESYWKAIFGGWLGLGGAFVFLCVALAIVMGLARAVGQWWWVLAAPAFVGLAALFAFVLPYLTPTHRLRDPALRAQVRQLERREGVGRIPVVVQDVRSDTSLPNAEAMGIGPSRRVVLWDTLVDGPFGERELRVVIAHELGHVARNHVLKSIGWYALFAFPGAFLIARATRGRGGMARPEALPPALLVLVVLSLLATPLENVITRHIEAEADWRALQATRDSVAAMRLFREFVPTTLDEPDPPSWAYVMLENHPTIMQRLAMAAAWQRRYAASTAQLP